MRYVNEQPSKRRQQKIRRTGWSEQHNNWSCGPYALKHAMLAYGIDIDPEIVMRKSHSIKDYGTTAHGLAKGAKSFGMTLSEITEFSEKKAKQLLLMFLKRKIPLLLSVDKDEHWIAAIGYKKKKIIIADSGMITVRHHVTWKYIAKRMFFEKRYDMFPLYNFR